LHEFVVYLSKKWNVVLSEKQTEDILDQSGGILTVIKELVWLRTVDPKNYFGDLSAMNHIKYLWNALEEDSRTVLTHLVFDLPIDEGLYFSGKYLEMIGLIKDRKLYSRLLVSYIRDAVSNPRQILANKDKLLIGGVDHTGNFSASQRLLLSELINNSGKVVSRDHLIEKVWGQNVISDWAFDSHIKRLRDRLEQTGVGSSHLITKKKRGLLWQ
jgi:hypothetical protein